MNSADSHSYESVPIDGSRATFASLPGELRNDIYKMTLRSEFGHEDIWLDYKTHDSRTAEIFPPCKRVVAAFAHLRRINHQIRYEVDTFFYANNSFVISYGWGDPTKGPPIKGPTSYLEAPVRFLSCIGQYGRSIIRSLKFVTGHYRYHDCKPDRFRTRFSEQLAQCGQLNKLSLVVGIYELFENDEAAVISYFRQQRSAPTAYFQSFANLFRCLAHRDHLELDLYCQLSYRRLAWTGALILSHMIERIPEIEAQMNQILQRMFAKEHQGVCFKFKIDSPRCRWLHYE
jgi:hypothetical protein